MHNSPSEETSNVFDVIVMNRPHENSPGLYDRAIESGLFESGRPVLLTNRGRGVAVVQSLKDYEAETEERSFLRGIVQGLMDLEEGREDDAE